MRKYFRAISLSCLVWFSSCVKLELEDHSLQFNEAAGSLNLRLVLLNGVRASKDYPLQFSAVNSYVGTGALSGSIGLTGPLRSFPSTATLSPRLDFKDGISQLNLADLNNAEAQNALKKPMNIETYRLYYYFAGARSIGVINAVMIERVEIERDLHWALHDFAWRYCAGETARGPVEHACEYRRQILARCERDWTAGGEWEWEQKTRLVRPKATEQRKGEQKYGADLKKAVEQKKPATVEAGGSISITYMIAQSSAAGYCAFHRLTLVGLNLFIAGINVEPKKKEKDAEQRPKQASAAQGATINIYTVESKTSEESKSNDYELSFSNADLLKYWDAQPHKQKTMKGALDHGSDEHKPIVLQFRSPERMVRFLGELIAAQNYASPPFIADSIDLQSGAGFRLLNVVRGTPIPGSAAVVVRDPEGEVFYVPKPDYGAAERDRSLELLSLVADLVNSAVSKKALPQVTTFTLSPS